MSAAAIPYDQAIGPAREAFRAWLDSLDRAGRVVVFCHFDADGLGAGALFGRGLPRLGFTNVEVIPSLRGESAFSDEARLRLGDKRPAALVVTDLGVHRWGVLPGVPTLYVDHHVPHGAPDGAAIVSGYGWEPIPNSAWLAFDLLAGEIDVDEWLWIAAVGTISDLGEKAPWPRMDEAKKRYTARWLKEAVALTNAARRATAFDVETPLRLLMEADGPRPFAEHPDAAVLADYRAEVNAEMAEARKAAPVFAAGQPWALVKMHSACQIHPLIAQQWRGRLPKYAVIGANTGYAEGEVAFSARTARSDLDLPALFQAVDLGEFNGRFGYGHDQASGGHLPPHAFNRLLDALGFPAGAHVPA